MYTHGALDTPVMALYTTTSERAVACKFGLLKSQSISCIHLKRIYRFEQKLEKSRTKNPSCTNVIVSISKNAYSPLPTISWLSHSMPNSQRAKPPPSPLDKINAKKKKTKNINIPTPAAFKVLKKRYFSGALGARSVHTC